MKKKILSLLLTIIVITMSFGTMTTQAEDKTTTQVVTTTQQQTTTTKPKFKTYKLYVKVNTANVRKKPNTQSKIVAKYHKGKKVTVYEVKGDWRRIGKDKWTKKTNLCKKDPSKYFNGVKLKYSGKYNVCKSPLTRRMGVKYFQGHKETYYSQRVLPGNGLKIPGRHVADDGTVRDKDGYIVVSCNYIKKGECIMTSLGPGKRYDCGSMTGKWIDIYVNW